MCLFCNEILKQTMTVNEVAKALTEFVPNNEDHWEDMAKIINENYNQQDVIENFWKVFKERL